MTELQYKTLCKSCDEVLNMDHFGSELIAIPWLHVIREHPVFLTQYEELFNKQINKIHKNICAKVIDVLTNL